MNERAYELWQEHEKQINKKFLFNTGVLWLCYNKSTPLVDDSIPFAKAYGREFVYLSTNELQNRYSVLDPSGLHHAWYDPKGGYLLARESTASVCEQFVREGGTYIRAEVFIDPLQNNRPTHLLLSNGNAITADAFIFACGAWLGKIFPKILEDFITCTRQEVFYFGVPAGKTEVFESFPVWVDVDGKDFYYGIPNNKFRGFKVGVDIRGPQFDPSSGNRLPDMEVLTGVRNFLAKRFPDLKDAPLLESRVCPYENSPDGNFLFDQHPDWENVFFLGGGSGHGFKHAPAVGELVTAVLTGQRVIPDCFLLKNRQSGTPG